MPQADININYLLKCDKCLQCLILKLLFLHSSLKVCVCLTSAGSFEKPNSKLAVIAVTLPFSNN